MNPRGYPFGPWEPPPYPELERKPFVLSVPEFDDLVAACQEYLGHDPGLTPLERRLGWLCFMAGYERGRTVRWEFEGPPAEAAACAACGHEHLGACLEVMG